MNRKNALPIPEPILQLQRQLDQFRSAQPQKTKLPEPLWQALRLDYMRAEEPARWSYESSQESNQDDIR